jgi:hypothetical protein
MHNLEKKIQRKCAEMTRPKMNNFPASWVSFEKEVILNENEWVSIGTALRFE